MGHETTQTGEFLKCEQIVARGNKRLGRLWWAEWLL